MCGQWWALVNLLMELCVPLNINTFLIRGLTGDFQELSFFMASEYFEWKTRDDLKSYK
jgi:hypothetical protein